MKVIHKNCFFMCITTILLHSSVGVMQSSVPAQLLECYRGGGLDPAAPRRLDVFLHVLRQLEAHRSQLDLRLFSTALLRSLRLDGIEQSANAVETEYLTPYRATGFQFQRYKLLMDLLLPSRALVNLEEDLSAEDKCLFHKMLSIGVRRWERGDENVVCPLTMQQSQSSVQRTDRTTGRSYSRCPIEDGVILTEWGTIAPGTVIAAIAAAMEAQTVAVKELLETDAFQNGRREDVPEINIETLDEVISTPRIANAEINNVWVATLAGDLAEVAVNQGPRVGAVTQNISIGSNNRWNDTMLPRTYYLFPQNETIIQWHITDAEIIAGIDGLIIAKELSKWTSKMSSLRLSQILEMYYSHSGVSFDENIKACNRHANFYKIFDQTELLREMSNFALILSLSQGTVYVPAEEVDRICQAVVTAFTTYLSDVLNRNQRACNTASAATSASAVDLVLATDGAWNKYQAEQFVSAVALAADVSPRRSSLGVLHGGTGVWVAPASPAPAGLTALFSHLRNFTDDWPNRLNFPVVLSSLLRHLTSKTLEEGAAGDGVATPSVVLVVSPNDRLSSSELEVSRELLASLRRTHFDVHFAFVARDLAGYYELNVEQGEDDISDLYLQVESAAVEEAARRVQEGLVDANIPKRIIGAHCDGNGTNSRQVPFEDYVTVGRKITYRIHPYYLRNQPLITIQVRTTSLGAVRACAVRAGAGAEGDTSCHELGTHETAVFNLTRPCDTGALCAPAYFTVSGVSTLNICANNDCRSPSEISFYVEHSGLRCLSLLSTAARQANESLFIIVACFTYLFFNPFV